MSEISFATLHPEDYLHDRVIRHAESGSSNTPVEVDDQGEDLDFSMADIERRPLSFDIINEAIIAAVEEGTPDSLVIAHAAQKLRDEMHQAYVLDVPFRPSLDPEMRDELAEWLVAEVDGLSLEAALQVVSLEGLDFPPVSESESTEPTNSSDLPQAV